ncbi:nuclear GTPase SLIP-GC-like isoform X2 [Clupea harengus]|uniref:Nuclear GTPase SLIP-GC-like isoform X2 n=1 Tax=Clupea harengus TaxID=7950 RepID=A0A6P8FDE9_CLUHA|nr:nuclear GTPase SLIP-GC-like isoform X2 [Clupea harengus]
MRLEVRKEKFYQTNSTLNISLSKTAKKKQKNQHLPNMRLVLLGKNELDNGRVGNLILGRDAFQTNLEVCEEHVSERVRGQVEGRPITVINTPDLFHPQRTQHELSVAVKDCVAQSAPGPHVFLLVLQPDSFSEEDRHKVKAILNLFSDEAMNYTIVLTTTVRSARHVSSAYTGEKEDHLGLIIQECKMRYQIFDEINRFSQVLKLFEKIDKMMEENGRRHLTCEEIGVIPGGSFLPESKQKAKRGRESDSHKEGEWKKKKTEINEISAIQQAQEVMAEVQHRLEKNIKNHAKTNKEFMNFIRDNMTGLLNKTIQKTTIGVFGKTGDGKSSLINAILDEDELLPTGTLDACTSVIIQVEAGAERDQYTATVEFISKEAWENELKSLLGFLAERKERDETICKMAEDKIEALYGKNATGKSFDELMNDDHSPVIAAMLKSNTKTISKFQASDLSEAIGPYIEHHESDLGGFYWPVVKTVRIKVPDHKGLLQNIVLVDLPGNGDCNQTRDEMWKSMLRECTAVWVVSDINRAASDKAAWEILKSSMTDMVQGGACTRITFICTKTDNMDPQSYIRSKRLNNRDLQITAENKYYIRRFSVFTVSSREFCSKEPYLKQEDTEIPKLREVLRRFNHSHANRVASQYFTSATGILSLIQTSKDNNAEMNMDKVKLHNELNKKLDDELKCLRVKHLEPCYDELEKCLSVGVKKSERKCAEITKKNVDVPVEKNGCGYHQTLSALCRNKGYFRSGDGETRDLNKSLAEIMYESINEKFNAFFPNEGEGHDEGSVREKVERFSVCSISVTEGYSNPAAMTHILRFLKAEEAKLKHLIYREIAQQKKEIYASITDTIKEEMGPGYNKAEKCVGPRSMAEKQRVLKQHTESLKHTMFKKAKNRMLTAFRYLTKQIEMMLEENLQEALAHARTESNFPFIMDVSAEIRELERLSALTDE